MEEDPILHFAATSLHFAQVVHLQSKNDVVIYAFALHVGHPHFALPKDTPTKKKPLQRYYLNQPCLNSTWNKRKLGCLYTLPYLPREILKVGDIVCLDVEIRSKGVIGTSLLPPSWSNTLASFFRYYGDPTKVTWMLSAQETRTTLFQDLALYYPDQGGADQSGADKEHKLTIFTLYYALVCLVTKDFSSIVDMMKYPRLRTHTLVHTFDDLAQHPVLQRAQLTVPTTFEFVVELALWAQDPSLLTICASQLQTQLDDTPTSFPKVVHTFPEQFKTQRRYVQRVLKQLSHTTS